MKALYSLVPRTVIDRTGLPENDFIAALKTDQPKELYVGPYSIVTPFIIVSHYYENALSFSCNALADKTEKCLSYQQFYDYVSNERSEMFYRQ